jgi:hypothetical protein
MHLYNLLLEDDKGMPKIKQIWIIARKPMSSSGVIALYRKRCPTDTSKFVRVTHCDGEIISESTTHG